MSKRKSNVNPDHYKTAGREAIGRDVVQEVQRQQFAQSKVEERKESDQKPSQGSAVGKKMGRAKAR